MSSSDNPSLNIIGYHCFLPPNGVACMFHSKLQCPSCKWAVPFGETSIHTTQEAIIRERIIRKKDEDPDIIHIVHDLINWYISVNDIRWKSLTIKLAWLYLKHENYNMVNYYINLFDTIKTQFIGEYMVSINQLKLAIEGIKNEKN